MRSDLICSTLGSLLLLITNSSAQIEDGVDLTTVSVASLIAENNPNTVTGPLTAAYALDEGTGSTANDASSNGNIGTIAGATWTGQGKFGNALSFSGFGNWVTITDSTTLDLSNGMTLQAWIRPTTVTGNWATVLLKEAPPGYHLAYHLELDPSNHPSSYITTDTGGLQGIVGPNPVSLGTWTHLAATYDGALLTLYVNGEPVVSRPASGNIIPSYGPLRFGGNSIWGEYFVGMIDELRVYNRSLTQAELQTDMKTPLVGPTPTPSPTASPTPPTPVQPLNLSTRLRVDANDNVLIGGFIITGTEPKSIALRGIGPSLAQAGVPDPLADPTLELHDSGGTLLMENDNWQDYPEQAALLADLGLGLTEPNESGLVTLLQPGAYTAILAGKNSATGVGLVEIYDANPAANSQLANISTRGFVLTGNSVMIGGFILDGTSPNPQIVVRGIGPSLAQIGLNPALPDPTLELHDINGTALVTNDNWQDDSAAATQLTASGLAPQDPLESAIVATLPPGLYTAILAGKNGGTGIGLVEIYNLQ